MFSLFENTSFNNIGDVHTKFRTTILKGFDFFLALVSLLLALFRLIEDGTDIATITLILSAAVFVVFFMKVNAQKYIKLYTINAIFALIIFLAYNFMMQQNNAVMIFSLMFFPISTLVWQKFYAFATGTVYLIILIINYYINIPETKITDSLPFITVYIMLSYFLMAASMIFKYTLKNTAEIFYAHKDKSQKDIEEKNNFIKRFSYNIRTSLSSITGIAEILAKNMYGEQKQLTDSLTACAKNIADITELLDGNISEDKKIEKTVFNKEVFDIEELITTTAGLVPGTEIKINTDDTLPAFEAETVTVRRIFLCIFEFFKKYSQTTTVKLCVRINKVKVPAVPVKYRFDLSSPDMVNLGEDKTPDYLEIAENLVKNLDGNIKYRFDEESSFVYFNIRLDEAKTTPALKHFSDKMRNNSDFISSKIKQLSQANVLICEDNPINQKVMTLSLEKYVGEIDIAFNGRECLMLFHKKQYDIILMDIQMPVLDGYATTKAIRQIEKREKKIRHIPIIAVTANTLSGDKEHCMAAGMDDYFSKPFNIDKIISKINEFLIKYPQP